MRFTLISSVLISVSVLSGCLCTHEQNDIVSYPKPFPEINVPAFITDRHETLAYLSKHMWDHYLDSAAVWSADDDSTRLGGVLKEEINRYFIDYAGFLWNLPVQDGLSAQKRFMEKLEKTALADTSASHVFDAFCSLAETVFYGVNSDYRNEEYYIPVLETLVNTAVVSPLTDESLRKSYEINLMDCMKNRIGSTASDFTFTTREGVNGTLHGVTAEHILLFFSNPGCNACLEIINSLKESPKITQLISDNRLKVLNIYIDADLTEWFNYMPIYPKEWINAYQGDLQVREKGLYSVRAIPSLYILDSSKKVLFKDVIPNIALSYLEQL